MRSSEKKEKISFRKIIAAVLAVVIFLGSIAFAVAEMTRYFAPKDNADLSVYRYLKEDEDDSIDVLFVGSSHVYYGVQPNILWNEYGISSYDIGSPSQTIPMSYYAIKEFLRYQTPKVIAVETYGIWYEEKYNSINDGARLRTLSDSMGLLSPVRLEMLNDFTEGMSFDDKVEYYAPFIRYHSRWAELEENDFRSQMYLKGSAVLQDIYPAEQEAIPEESTEVPENVMVYMQKIQELCDENSIELMVFLTPVSRYINEDGSNFTEDLLAKTNTLYAELTAEGVPCINYQDPDVLEFDWPADFGDWTHLNITGSTKLTEHLGIYLTEHYALEDHRGDSAYAKWDSDYLKYQNLVDSGLNSWQEGIENAF